MKFFAILLCIAIGSVSGELQRRKFWKEKLEVTEDINETRSPISVDDGKNPYSSEESLRAKYDQDNSFDQIVANTKDADSAETETSRNPSPVIETSTVKSTSSKAIKKNFEIMYIPKPERKEANLVRNRRLFLRRKRMAEVEDPTNLVESYKMYKKVREKLPAQLRMKTRKTDTAEEKLLNSYATSNGDTSNLIADYNSAKSAEREQLKVDASGSGATEVIENYKALRKGKPWNYIKLRGKLQGLFGKSSPSLTEYETLKQDEVASIDSFLGGSSNTEGEKVKTVEPQAKETPAEEKAKTVEPQEKEKPAEEKAKTVEPQEKEKPAEEKATNAQSKEKETPTDEKDWLSTEPAENNPLDFGLPAIEDDNAEKDSHMFETWIDSYSKMFDIDFPDTRERFYKSWNVYDQILEYLSKDIRYPMTYTDEAEKALLRYSRDTGKFRKAYLDIYYECRRKEIEALKAHLAKKSEKLRERILLYYKSIRRVIPWFWMKVLCRGFFEGSVPKPAVDKYISVKKEEQYTDQYLDGSMKIGEVPKKDENTTAEASENKWIQITPNAQVQERELTDEEKEWMNTAPAENIPCEFPLPRDSDDNAEKDSKMFDPWIDTQSKMGDKDYEDTKDNKIKNLHVHNQLYGHLSQDLRNPMTCSDDAETDLLKHSADDGKFRKAYLNYYYALRKTEIEALKAYLASKPENIRERILLYYKSIRKGIPWFWIRKQYGGFFEGKVPKPAVDKYLAVKKEELYTDQYLDGSMKIGEVPKKDENTKAEASEKPSSQNEKPKEDETKKATEGEQPKEEKSENPKVEAFERASSQTKSEKANRKLRTEVAQVARAEEDEKAEEMERGVRAKETETVEVEYDDYGEHIENIFATSDDVKEDVEVHGSPDNVTSADVRNTETTTDKKTKDNSHLLRFAILLAMVSQVIIAILILAPQRDKLTEWCKRRKRTESGPSESEPLQAGEKVFATGPTSKVLKVSSHRRPDVADANQ